ncbi:MAG: M20/M25/M40 family metallo-hydrolase, partial [Actinomycetota bacterium]|nr:M20/M25/M40 family metallo-hydrolase [Actinomycetota bacterium]
LVDVRTVRGQDHHELTEAMRHLCSSVGEASIGDARGGLGGDLRERLRPGMRDGLHLSVELEVLEDRPWTQTGREEPIVRAVDAAVREVSGREPVYNGVPGATDGTFLSAIKGIPIVTIGAGDRFVPHQKNEWVDLDQLLETARIYAAAALLFLERGA